MSVSQSIVPITYYYLALLHCKLLIVLYYVWVVISAILWPGCPSAVLYFIIVLLLI